MSQDIKRNRNHPLNIGTSTNTMFNQNSLFTIFLWTILVLIGLTYAHPSPLNSTSLLEARLDPCTCITEGRFCVGLIPDGSLSGVCPAEAIITCKKKNISKKPNQIQYCTHSWPSTGKGKCYRKDSGKLKCK